MSELHPPETDFVGLRKTWLDPGPGIELVELHYAWTPLGGDPNWESGDCRVLMPDERAPGLRTAVIEIPRQLDGSPTYALHHFFFVVRGTDRQTSPVLTEEIVTRELTYTDESGHWDHVGLVWGVSPGAPELVAPNYTVAVRDLGSRVFRGPVRGPRGFEVRYVYHLLRGGGTGADTEETWVDNGGAGWAVTL